MSIFDAPADATPVDSGAPVDSGVTATPDVVAPVAPAVPDAGGVETPVETPAPQYLDLEEYGNHLVKVKINGEDRELPFSEVRNGLMMQQAFTQNTQQLAEERRKLHQAEALVAALESDTAETLRSLAEAYDLDPGNNFSQAERTPEERQLRQMQQQMAQAQEALQRQRLDNEINTIRQQYGDFDVQAAAKRAYESGSSLTEAFKAMQFDQLREQQLADAEANRRRQAAAAASGAVAGGGSAKGGAGVVAPPAQRVNSIKDAWRAARAEHNI